MYLQYPYHILFILIKMAQERRMSLYHFGPTLVHGIPLELQSIDGGMYDTIVFTSQQIFSLNHLLTKILDLLLYLNLFCKIGRLKFPLVGAVDHASLEELRIPVDHHSILDKYPYLNQFSTHVSRIVVFFFNAYKALNSSWGNVEVDS